MTEVLPEASAPHQDHQHHHDGQHQGGEHPAMFATPPHTFPPSAPPSMAGPTHHPGAGPSSSGTQTGTPSVAHRGREKLHWDHKVWQRLDHAVHREIERTRVAAKFLPVHRVPEKTTSIESDIVIVPPGAGPLSPLAVIAAAPTPPTIRWAPQSAPPPNENYYQVDEGATTRLVEIWVEFSLTPQQVEQEGAGHHDQHSATHPAYSEPTHHDQHTHNGQHGLHDHHGHHGDSTAITLATRAANILAQAEDSLLFNGLGAFSSPLYTNFVRWRAAGQPTDFGLLDAIPFLTTTAAFGALPASQVIQVQRKAPPAAGQPPSLYGENTFEAVTAGYAQLMAAAQYGPYALTLHNVPYADSFAPLPATLIMPADRIAPLMTAGLHDSGTLDSPGATAIAQGLAATPTANTGEAAANAAAAYAINYGVGPANQTPPTANALLLLAAEIGSMAAQEAGATPGAGKNHADTLGAAGASNAANSITNFPGNPVTVSAAGLTPAPPTLPYYYGSLVSLGGNTMDRVVGIEPTVGFMQQDVDGNFRFRVFERLALRVKDISAVIRLEFMGPSQAPFVLP